MAARDAGIEIHRISVVRVTKNGGFLVSLFDPESAIKRWLRCIALCALEAPTVTAYAGRSRVS
jgi:hypothetical protein